MLAEQGVAPAAWDSQSPPRDASGSRPALLRGSAFDGWTREWNETGESRMDTWGLEPPVPPRKHGPEVKNRHSGAPGGARAGHTARSTARCQMKTIAPFGAPLPHAGEGRKRTADPKARLRASGRAMADQKMGAMNHARITAELVDE